MIQGLLTLTFMMMFIIFCLWLLRPGAKKHYQQAALIPLDQHSVDDRKEI